ncbi:MAG: helix-turn-helix transcriptional regulator [Emcibacter sp.]|nr:helix-turn-helix transcriptional regulator [Emcibacter sp.]
MNLKKMAELSSIAQSTLSKIENDIISPGFDKVMQICHALDIDISQLIKGNDGTSNSDTRPVARLAITRQDEKTLITTDSYISNFLCSSISKKVMIPVISHLKLIDGDDNDIELIRHPGEEFTYILEGRVKIVMEHYEPVYLEQGDSLYLDSPMGHLYVNAGDNDAIILSVSLSKTGR